VAFTLVAFHAHPDDEALLTAGTLARAAAEGHRVVLVVATAGEAGLVRGGRTGPALADRRRVELDRSAQALGVARVELLGYADSGMQGEAGGADAFARADVEQAAGRLARILTEESADLLTIYDPAGGYGHPDHVKVYEVGLAAAAAAGVDVVYEATVDREYLHFVETHLVVEAGGHTGALGLAATDLGTPTVAVWKSRLSAMGVVEAQVPLAGLKISAVLTGRDALLPPATSTRPFGSRVAVWLCRDCVIDPVGDHSPLFGS